MDSNGRRVATLVSGQGVVGAHVISFNGGLFASSAYNVSLESGGKRIIQSLQLVR